MICPACGARNTDGAEWCTQCFVRLDADPAASPTRAPASRVTRPQPASARTAAVDHPDVRTTEDGVEWCCATCESWTSIDRFTCSACGLRMGTPALAPASPSDVTDLGARAMLVPGGGHLALGQRGTGTAVLVTVALWLVGGVLLAHAAIDSSQLPLSGLVLLFGAVGLWVVAARDARVLAGGGRRLLLQGSVLVWVIAGVTGLLVLSLLFASLSAVA